MIAAVVMFSGGAGSWAAAKRAVARYGADAVTLLFCDTRIEDPDLYRFLDDAAANVGARLVRVADGRTPWEVFRDERFLGNARVGLCSRVLKQDVADAWLAAHAAPDAVVVSGIGWSEAHRADRLAARYAPRPTWAPLTEAPYLDAPDVLAWMHRERLTPPRLYALGFAHNNCGGGCVRAGHGHFAHLLRTLPDVFGQWEENEAELRAELGDVAILRDRTGGTLRPLPLAEFRARVDAGHQPDLFDIGGCGCFVDREAA